MNHETHKRPEKIIFKEEYYEMQRAIFDVYKEIGWELLEAVYQSEDGKLKLDVRFEDESVGYPAVEG